MCTDRFAGFLSINTLKEPDAVAETSEPTMEDSKTVGGSGSCISTSDTSGSQLPEAPRDGPLFDDGSILTLMVKFLLFYPSPPIAPGTQFILL